MRRFLTRVFRTRAARSWWLYLLVLVVASTIVYGGLLAHPGDHVFADNDDTSLFIWWIGHAADVVSSWFGGGHGDHSLLYTHEMNAPTGVNGAWNTSVVGLALPLVPLTWLAGPVVAFNAAIVAAPVVDALAAALLARLFMARPAAFLAGFAFGFSPYVVAQSSGHLNLAFVPAIPLALWALLRMDRCRTRGARRACAAVFGLVLGWQFYVSTEVLAGMFLAGCVFVLSWAVFDLRGLRVFVQRTWTQLLAAVGLALCVGASLLIVMTTAPGAPQQTIRPTGVWNSDLLDLVVPGTYTWIGSAPEVIPRQVPIDPAEIGAYLSIIWLVLVLVVTWRMWRHPVLAKPVRITAVAGALMFLLSMGSPLYVAGEAVLPWGPFALVEALPVLGNVLPMRLAVYSTLAASLLLGIAWQTRYAWSSGWARDAVTVGVLGSLVMSTSGPVTTRTVDVPDFYTDEIAERIPEGSVVKTLPRPQAMATPHADETMVYQAVSGFSYAETGGYFIGSTDTSPVVYSTPPDAVDVLLEGQEILPEGADPLAAEAMTELAADGVDFVVVSGSGWFLPHEASDIADYLGTSSGLDPVETQGVYLLDLRSLG